MAQDATTIARPYAEAVFERAEQTASLDSWSEMLAFLAGAVTEPALSELIGLIVDRQARQVHHLGRHLRGWPRIGQITGGGDGLRPQG